MKYYNNVSLLIFLLVFTNSFSQDRQGQDRQASAQQYQNMNFKVSGKVLDVDTGQALEYATISLSNQLKKDEITGGITDENGNFSIEVKPGMYNIKIDYISFESFTKEKVVVRSDLSLGEVKLNIDVNLLEEVEVRAERTEVEIRLDKKIYNIGQDITVRGGSVSDVLANIPSLEVDIDGNVSLRGNSNVKILINGKPSGLVGLSGPEGLRSIPSESIQQVEVVTSPSARYEAEGTAGILNIILKKQDLLGFNGNINLNAGIPKQSGINGSFNLRNNKVNFFNTTSIRNRSGNGYGFSKTSYSNLLIDENNNWESNDYNFFTTFGIEYFIDDKTSIILSSVYKDGNGDSFNENIVKDISSGSVRSINYMLRNETEEEFSNEY